MASRVRHVTLDCTDPHALATFWAGVLDAQVDPDDEPGDDEALVASDGATLLFVRVPDAKQGKNRVHLDLQPSDRARDAEVARLLDLGARVVSDHRRPDGQGWVTLADPEGNELCVERSAAERE